VKVFCHGQVRTAGHGIVGGLGVSKAGDGMRPKSGGSLQERHLVVQGMCEYVARIWGSAGKPQVMQVKQGMQIRFAMLYA
jgi:hypothetical protein